MHVWILESCGDVVGVFSSPDKARAYAGSAKHGSFAASIDEWQGDDTYMHTQGYYWVIRHETVDAPLD